MVFQEGINDYLNYGDFTKRSLERYKYILEVYYNFLFNNEGLNDSSVFTYLSGVTYKEVLISLDFYIKNYGVKAEDTCLLYISVIKEFLKYLTKTETIKNSSIIFSFGLADSDKQSFNYHASRHIEKLIKERIIKKSNEGTPFNEEQIAFVIDYCNDNLLPLQHNKKENKENIHNRFVKSLIVKLVIFTGVSVSDRVYQLKIKDINMESGYLCIEGYRVYLPFNLRNQFSIYLSEIYNGNINDLDSYLFLNYKRERLRQANFVGALINNVLSRLEIRPLGLKPSSTICLAKYAIIQLIDLGIDRDTIILFTGYGDTVISSCKNYADAGKEAENIKLMTNTLKTLPLFDVL
ncbi:hypothetical protein [Anaerocolumna sp.]|uniref:hypothetical protein n=1 Tax=Anaerocolumna sp. TaxID=2041569 RepID=UPI0028AFE7D6|nr:hypothetical protein [Anaerocolumna sp.]